MVVDRKRQTTPLNIPHTHPNKNKSIPTISAASVENRRVHTWVRDSVAKTCYSCKTSFSILNRKHHCRLCGRIYCATCSHHRLKIPDFLRNFLPRPPHERLNLTKILDTDSHDSSGSTKAFGLTGTGSVGSSGSSTDAHKHDVVQLANSPETDTLMGHFMDQQSGDSSSGWNGHGNRDEARSGRRNKYSSYRGNEEHSGTGSVDLTRPKRLCKPCYQKLTELTRLRHLIHLFGLPGTTVQDLKAYSLVCKDWLSIASYHLSRFREIQYYLPCQQFSRYDRQMLWDSRDHLLGHSIWLTQLIRSLDYDRVDQDERLQEIIQMLGLQREKRIIIEPVTEHPLMIRDGKSTCDEDEDGDEDDCDSIGGVDTVTDFQRASNKKLSLSVSNSGDSGCGGGVSEDIIKVDCWTLMCTRNCQSGLRAEDALCLLDHRTQAPELRQYAMSFLERISLTELRCYLPLLVHYMKFESLDNPIIGRSLLRAAVVTGPSSTCTKSDKKERLLYINDLYWQWTVAMESRSAINTYKYFLDQFCNTMDKSILEAIFKGKHMSVTLQYLLDQPDEEKMRRDLSCQLSGDALKHLASPTNPYLRYRKIITEKVKHTDSASRPIILPFQVQTSAGNLRDHLVLFKNEDLRKDKIIINLIRLTNIILKREENLDLGLITYEVCSTSSSGGVLEMVPRCRTLYDIKERMSLSINNFIDSHNDNVPVHVLRKRFVRSCAGYCVITYLLGIGDRHLDNIMVTEDGYIFHIDYGFILGVDPKPMTVPKMRLTVDMVEAMGGTDSKYYAEFKEISNQIYNCLRRHVGLFINMLGLLIDCDPPIENRIEVTREMMLKEVYKRFIPGETYHEAQIQLETEIEQSSQNYTNVINDFFHRHAREKTLRSTVGSTLKSLKGFFK